MRALEGSCCMRYLQVFVSKPAKQFHSVRVVPRCYFTSVTIKHAHVNVIVWYMLQLQFAPKDYIYVQTAPSCMTVETAATAKLFYSGQKKAQCPFNI